MKVRLLGALDRSDEVEATHRAEYLARPSAALAGRWLAAAASPDDVIDEIEAVVLARRASPREPAIGRTTVSPNDHEAAATLLEIGRIDRAWEVALTNGAPSATWRRLAEVRRAEHPADLIGVLAQEIERHIDGRAKPAYRKAVKTLTQLRSVAEEADLTDLADDVVAGVRLRHGNKPSLMKLWPTLE